MTHIKCILIGGGANSAVGRVHKDALALSKHKWEIIDACFSRDSERHRESVELWNLPECPHESIENILQKHENKSKIQEEEKCPLCQCCLPPTPALLFSHLSPSPEQTHI